MPKYGIHHIVLYEAIGKLLGSPSNAAQQAGTILATHKDFAMLGAVGPDLFFWAPDYELVRKLHKLHKNVEEVVDLYNKSVQPIRDIRDAVVEPVEAAVETLTPSTVSLIRRLIEEMKETAGLFNSAVSTGLFAGVIEGFNFLTDLTSLPSLSANFFQYFRPPLQDGKPESDWYWFDMLHYRQTGEFGRRLVEKARAGTTQEQAYAYGYLSHIATDLVGHAFVNQIVGGPYRMQVQRHVTVENFMDCWKFQKYYKESINLALLDKLGLPLPGTLPDNIVNLLNQSFRDTYSKTHPTRLPGDGYLNGDQIRQTYEIFYEVLKIMKRMAVSRPEEPFTGVADILGDALRDLLESPPSPPSSPGSLCSWDDILSLGLTSSSRNCYEEFFDRVADWLEYAGELLVWAFETMLDLFDLLLTLLLSLPVVVLLAILYGLQLLLYEIYQSVRSVLALEGFIFPEPYDLNTCHGRNLTTTFQCSIPPSFDDFPRWTDLSVSHLVCPSRVLESPETAADFHISSDSITPDVFIKEVPFNLNNLMRYAKSRGPRETRALQRDQVQIGNAKDLTEFMIATAHDSNASDDLKELAFTNWNLDSDRGYGYKTWTWKEMKATSGGGHTIIGEEFIP